MGRDGLSEEWCWEKRAQETRAWLRTMPPSPASSSVVPNRPGKRVGHQPALTDGLDGVEACPNTDAANTANPGERSWKEETALQTQQLDAVCRAPSLPLSSGLGGGRVSLTGGTASRRAKKERKRKENKNIKRKRGKKRIKNKSKEKERKKEHRVSATPFKGSQKLRDWLGDLRERDETRIRARRSCRPGGELNERPILIGHGGPVFPVWARGWWLHLTFPPAGARVSPCHANLSYLFP